MSEFHKDNGNVGFGFHFPHIHIPGVSLNPFHTFNPVWQAKQAAGLFHHGHHHGHHQVTPHPAHPQSPHGADMAMGYSPYGGCF